MGFNGLAELGDDLAVLPFLGNLDLKLVVELEDRPRLGTAARLGEGEPPSV